MTGFEARDYTQIGPQIGQAFPNVVLPDQSGQPIDLHHVRRGRRAIIVFYRSASW